MRQSTRFIALCKWDFSSLTCAAGAMAFTRMGDSPRNTPRHLLWFLTINLSKLQGFYYFTMNNTTNVNFHDDLRHINKVLWRQCVYMKIIKTISLKTEQNLESRSFSQSQTPKLNNNLKNTIFKMSNNIKFLSSLGC